VPPVETPVVPEVAEPAPVDSVVDSQVVALGSDSGAGKGNGSSGQGSGTGGTNGNGNGPGSGPGSGPGNGGTAGFAQQPRPKQLVITPENKPKELRGQTIRVMFWIQEDGRVERVEFDPEIRNREYANKLRERLLDDTLPPARSASGEAIAVQFPIDITF
jgi:hypothetical protein